MMVSMDPMQPPSTKLAHVSAPSPLVLWLGYGGLVPFVAMSLAVGMQPAMAHGLAQSALLHALSAYGALIASFLGGVHWGVAARTDAATARFHHAWGVIPSLLAWVALLLPNGWRLVALAAILALCLAVDVATYPRMGWANWLRLRWHLTLVAAASCLLAAVATLTRHA
jgi:Protein of unknown function (DUF3429)